MSDTATSSETNKKKSGLPAWATGFGAQVFAGVLIGLILGFVASGMSLQWLSDLLSGVGNAYVQLLRVMVPPLIFAAVVTSVANLRKVANAAALQIYAGMVRDHGIFIRPCWHRVALVMRPGINSPLIHPLRQILLAWARGLRLSNRLCRITLSVCLHRQAMMASRYPSRHCSCWLSPWLSASPQLKPAKQPTHSYALPNLSSRSSRSSCGGSSAWHQLVPRL